VSAITYTKSMGVGLVVALVGSCADGGLRSCADGEGLRSYADGGGLRGVSGKGWGGAGEGRLVVAPAASLRPSAERKKGLDAGVS
jgi:hypothetical protein